MTDPPNNLGLASTVITLAVLFIARAAKIDKASTMLPKAIKCNKCPCKGHRKHVPANTI